MGNSEAELPNSPSHWECATDCFRARLVLGEAAVAAEMRVYEPISALICARKLYEAQRVSQCQGPDQRTSLFGKSHIWCPAVKSALVRD